MKTEERTWKAKWIDAGHLAVNWTMKAMPAPYFRKEFDFSGGQANLYICGLGYYEVHLNGKKVGDDELNPPPARYDVRCRYSVYDISHLLRKGRNAVACVLGCGMYDSHTAEVWHFDKAPWRNQPRLLMEITSGDDVLVATDSTWKVTDAGPIRFNGLRNGEHYDATREMDGWTMPGFDDSSWRQARVNPGPGGLVTRQLAPPCKVMETFEPVRITPSGIADFGQNLAGRAKITVKGEKGSSIVLRYSEKLAQDESDIDVSLCSCFILEGDFQTEKYTLRGNGTETWHSRFTYHGFRYVKITIEGQADLLSIEAQAIHTGFTRTGDFHCDNQQVMRLFHAVEWSYRNNFVGIPTDCPHREKCGWTGDAHVMCDLGLFLFDTSDALHDWLRTLVDCQRPNGQLPGIAPTGGWGFNWGNGPVWDAALFVIPEQIYIFTGNDAPIREFYPNMKRYLHFVETIEEEGIVDYGLGEWHPWDEKNAPQVALMATAYYYKCLCLMERFARLIGNAEDAAWANAKAQFVRRMFNRRFLHSNGLVDNGSLTALAIPMAFGLCPSANYHDTLQLLVKTLRARHHVADCGIFGAKLIPEILAENGYMDDAWTFITQQERPGWMYWIRHGFTTLPDDWAKPSSLDHVMFGSPATWMMKYLAGFSFAWKQDAADCSEFVLKPRPVEGITSLEATCNGVTISWKLSDGVFDVTVASESNVQGTLVMPDGGRHAFGHGISSFRTNFQNPPGKTTGVTVASA